jgi:hypothetical protein
VIYQDVVPCPSSSTTCRTHGPTACNAGPGVRVTMKSRTVPTQCPLWSNSGLPDSKGLCRLKSENPFSKREQRVERSQAPGMTTFKAIWFVVMILGFAVCGWLCVFRTDMLVTWGRKNAKTKFAWSPFSSIPMKPQYPTYIRWAGIFLWFWAIAIIYAVVVLHFR